MRPVSFGKLTILHIVYFLGALFLVGCGHTPEMRSPRLIQAIEFNQQGEKAFNQGDFNLAISNFQESLHLNQSLENIDGIAVNQLNLAKVFQMQGNLSESHRYTDNLLSERILHFSSGHLAAAATRKSLLLLQQHDLAMADHWIEQASVFCDEKCSLSGSILNVKTLIALERGDTAAAVILSDRALKGNAEASRLERANALRLAGKARFMSREYAQSLSLLEQALALDKQLGLPEKITSDMELLAMAHAAVGDAQKAEEYQERAKRVTHFNH